MCQLSWHIHTWHRKQISEKMFQINVMFRTPYQAHTYYMPRQSLFPYVWHSMRKERLNPSSVFSHSSIASLLSVLNVHISIQVSNTYTLCFKLEYSRSLVILSSPPTQKTKLETPDVGKFRSSKMPLTFSWAHLSRSAAFPTNTSVYFVFIVRNKILEHF